MFQSFILNTNQANPWSINDTVNGIDSVALEFWYSGFPLDTFSPNIPCCDSALEFHCIPNLPVAVQLGVAAQFPVAVQLQATD